MPRFILCADDFALSEGISGAILDLLGRRRLSATSAMTNNDNWLVAAPRLKEFAGRADIGVHLNLTCGASLSIMSRLAPTGELPTLGRVLRRVAVRSLPIAEISDEFRRQIDAFARGLGREPDFIDGHQHVHAFAGVREALFAALDTLGLTQRVYVRDPADSAGAILARRLSRGFELELDKRGIASNRGFAGFTPFSPRRDYARDFPRFLREPGDCHLVMCHPGLADHSRERPDRASAARLKEHVFLASEAFPALLAKSNCTLARFRELPR
jgi:chitin disaccharide deacetylase